MVLKVTNIPLMERHRRSVYFCASGAYIMYGSTAKQYDAEWNRCPDFCRNIRQSWPKTMGITGWAIEGQ